MPRGAWNYAGVGGYTPVDPDALAYFTAAEAAGATYTNTTKEALDTFVVGMKSVSLWALVRRWNPMLADGGNVLAGVAVVLNDTVGAANVDTLNNYVAGDWNAASGLRGNGSTTFIDTGWSPSAAQINLGWYGAKLTGNMPASGRTLFGCGNATDLITLTGSTTQERFRQGGSASSPVTANAMTSAIYSGERTSSTACVMYKNNVSIASDATATTVAAPIGNLTLMAFRTYPAATLSTIMSAAGERLAGYIFMNALNGTQRGNLQTLWAAFNTAIGR